MGLLPLEFRDCLTDSPQFRENLASHEKELETTSQSMKSILKEIKELLSAARSEYARNYRHFLFWAYILSDEESDDVPSKVKRLLGVYSYIMLENSNLT